MTRSWILIPAPNWQLLSSLGDRYERTGEGEIELSTLFQYAVLNADVLVHYAVLLAGRPTQS